MVAAFRAAHHGAVGRAAFSVAGPVIGGTAHITNLPWRLDEARLAQALGVADVLLRERPAGRPPTPSPTCGRTR